MKKQLKKSINNLKKGHLVKLTSSQKKKLKGGIGSQDVIDA